MTMAPQGDLTLGGNGVALSSGDRGSRPILLAERWLDLLRIDPGEILVRDRMFVRNRCAVFAVVDGDGQQGFGGAQP